MTRLEFTQRLKGLLAALRALPYVRFALMLGGGLVATAAVAWIVGYLMRRLDRALPVEVLVVIAQGLVWIALAQSAVILIVMIALAWGKVGKISAGFGGANVEIDLDDG